MTEEQAEDGELGVHHGIGPKAPTTPERSQLEEKYCNIAGPAILTQNALTKTQGLCVLSQNVKYIYKLRLSHKNLLHPLIPLTYHVKGAL